MRKIALIAYDLNPEIGSECREAFLWLTILAKHYKINAFVCDTHRQSLENIQQPNIHFTFIPVSSFLRKFASKTGLYFLPVSNFMQKIEHIFKDKTFCREFDLIHFLTSVDSFI